MFMADNPKHESKHEAELDNIAILRELKLFFMNNKHQDSESQDCPRYNSILEAHNAILVYVEDEKIHKLFVNDETLEPQSAIQTLTAIIKSLEALNPQNAGRNLNTSNTNKARPKRDVITITGSVTVATGGVLRIGGGDTIINNPVYVNHMPILDEAALDSKAAQALAQLKAGYFTPEYTTILGIFGSPLQLEGQYINLQMLCVDLKTKKTEEAKESKESAEAKHDKKYKDARMASVEDLFGDKRAIKAENLFKPSRELFNKELETVKDAYEVPRLLLVQGRAGIGKTTFVRYVAHKWSTGELYANYTWVFTLTLRKLRLFPNMPELSLSEWIRKTQFSSLPQEEFEKLWQQRIEPAIHQNKVLLILDGYDETPENHPCQFVLENLLTGHYSNLALLITTRPCGVQDITNITKKRRNLEIIGFTDENINQYIQTYFSKVPDKALVGTLTETLRKQPVIWANAHIPLNLNLLCGIMEEAIQKASVEGLTQGLAQLSSMTRLYQVMEKKLYERSHGRHDTCSHTGPRKIGGQLIRARTDFVKHYQKERLFLAKLAFQSFEAERIIISLEAIGEALQAYVDKEVNQGSQRSVQQEKEKLAKEFFDDDVCKLGLIKPVLDKSGLPQAQQDYEFLHLTFQEYYTAIYLAESFSSQEPTTRAFAEKIIAREKYNPRWQIVWWFFAGFLRENMLIYEIYLQQLQGQCVGQTLTQDIFEHYQLALLTRCVDEGFEPHNQQAIEPIVKQLQSGFLRLYQMAKNVTNNCTDERYLKRLTFINSPFFSACRISPNLCMSEKQDLCALIPDASQEKELAWIGAVQIVTPKLLLTLTHLSVDTDRDVRRHAIQTIDELGEAVITPKILSALAELLGNMNRDVRCNVIRAVGKLGKAIVTPKILSALTELLGDMDREVCRNAIQTIGKLGKDAVTPKILSALTELLGNMDREVRCDAVQTIGKLGKDAVIPKILSALTELLGDMDREVRCDAIQTVGKLGKDAVTPKMLEVLTGLLSDRAREVPHDGLKEVKELGEVASTPKMLDALAKLLADKNGLVRCYAADVVGELGTAVATPQILDALLMLLEDKNGDSDVRCSTAQAVGRLGSVAATPKILAALTDLLSDEASDVRRYAVEAMGEIGAAVIIPPILEILTRLLVDTDRDVRFYAAKTLDKMGGSGTQKLKEVLKLLVDKNPSMRRNAARVVHELGTAAATPQVLGILARLLEDPDWSVRGPAAETVGKLGEPAATPEILNALGEVLSDEDTDSDICYSFTQAVGRLGGVAATPKILHALAKLLKDSSMREPAVEAIGKLGASAATSEILEGLFHFLRDKSSEHRNAVQAVGELGGAAVTPKILDALVELLRDPSVYWCAADALGKLGVAAITPEVLNALVELLGSTDPSMRQSAARAIAALGPGTLTPKIGHALTVLLVDEVHFENIIMDSPAKNAIDELGRSVTPEFLDLLLSISSVSNNNNVLPIFGECIGSVFTLMPSFWEKNATHPNILAFVSYILAAAYLTSRISCQIDFDKQREPAGYYMRGFVEGSRYCFLITEAQAQSLSRLSSLIIGQLSKTGKLDIANLKKHLLKWKAISFAQNLLLANQRSLEKEGRNVIHLARNLGGSASEQKSSPMLMQYQQGSRGASEGRTNQNYREVKSACRIS